MLNQLSPPVSAYLSQGAVVALASEVFGVQSPDGDFLSAEALGPGIVEQLGQDGSVQVHWEGAGFDSWLDAQDLRKAALLVAGQEVLTADNIGLKVSVLVTYQVTDPAKAAHDTQNWHGDLHNAAQIALRTVVSGVAVETLLGQRLDISAQLLARVQPEAAKVGINVQAVEVKDLMFPAELKRAFADVLKAKQEGQAALERARGESASLRNLANAARVLEGNPALMNLRLMQSLTAAQHAGNTLVVGMPGGFVPLKPGKPAASAGAGESKENGDAEA